MTESTGSGGAGAQDVTSAPSGNAAGGEGQDLHGTAREVYENEEGGAEDAATTPAGEGRR